jgi:alpha/beta superfamily hydrolase
MIPPRVSLERLAIAGAAGRIDAIVEDPGVAGSAYAVVCHPHPLYGGTMDNKVVTTLARALHACAIPTIRFNFRGVGGSEGNHDGGRGESADAAVVAAWGAQRWPARQLVVAGFSFGAYVAMRSSGNLPVSRLILIAPPVERFDFSSIPAPRVPWLVVQGDADDVVDPQKVAAWAGAAQPGPALVMLPGVGHFFHGHLQELRESVINAIRSG